MSWKTVLFLLFSATNLILTIKANSCASRTTDSGIVCVCNSTYCDTVPTLANLSSGEYQLYSTSESTAGFSSTTGKLSSDSSLNTITVDVNTTYQTIVGFGGAFSDATGINILNLPEAAQNYLLESYFGENGIQYSLCRVPVGGTDFSLQFYTYCDTEDPTLGNFSLQTEDLTYKIPLIQKAIQLRNSTNGTLNLFASAWSAPLWMKNGNATNGYLKTEYYQLWADYYLKFFDAYSENNISFWGMTTQNEPLDGFFPEWISKIPGMGWWPDWMQNWLGTNLGPTIRNSSYSDLKILLHDDQRVLLPFLSSILSNETVLQYADGVAVHWYTDFFTPASFMNIVKSTDKDLILIGSEACTGNLYKANLEVAVDLGSWSRGVQYIGDILDDLEYDAVGWVEWNMALNTSGGPTYIDNNVDSAIIVNETAGEFYKQPMYYVLGHFSKFLVPGSVRLETDVSLVGGLSGLRAVAFRRPDNLIAVIIYNSHSSSSTVQLTIAGTTGSITVEGSSLSTLLYAI